MKFITLSVVQLIRLCTRWPWAVIALSIVLTAVSTHYAVRHFAMNTDIGRLISPDLPWRQRELAFDALFPQFDTIAIVVQAPTPERATRARSALTKSLEPRRDLFKSIQLPGGGEFFARHGLL